MRFSEAWLREWVNPPLSTDAVVAQLTMAGLEVEATEPAAGEFSGVVVGEVLALAPHPEADRLRVCQVAAGGEAPLTIVCGAPNVEVGMKAPLAVQGAVLPGGLKIGKSKLRGVESFGMLCSAKELGFDDGQSGLLALPKDAPVGADLRDYLQLDDTIIELNLTPNRADCLSVEGVAREVALLNGIDLAPSASPANPVGSGATLPVALDAPEACPRYLGRMIQGVNRAAPTPLWMRERLRRSGIRSLGPLVDVTNYVLLELGQPLHAFDAAKLQGGIRVRHGLPGEKLLLLNGQEITLDADVLVIADESRALALAGIMGGEQSAVGDDTQDIFLECAFFTPHLIMGKARRYGLSTDSSHRFERGVDPKLQTRAIERATQLLLDIVGGAAGPIVEAVAEAHLPKREPIVLLKERVAKRLGVAIPDGQVAGLLSRLGMALEPWQEGWDASLTPRLESRHDGWRATPPSFRFDVAIEADLIEEIGRVYGYNNIPKRNPGTRMELRPVSEARLDIERAKDVLVDRGYQEAITYSFVEPAMQAKVEPLLEAIALKNPISAELAVMRTGLWCGLLDAALKNLNRQQSRVRLFEAGLRFTRRDGAIVQEKSLAGLALGGAHEEQWGEKARHLDFFDVKADVEALLRLAGHEGVAEFASARHPALHPGQCAEIRLDGQALGLIGLLHPKLEKELGFEARVFLFELDQDRLLERAIPSFKPLSKFPQVRRDIALLVDESTTAGSLAGHVKKHSPLIRQVLVFDVYQGQGIEAGRKSVALGLVVQDDAETLTDARVDGLIAEVLASLAHEFNAKLRD
jgi:phenylalanyl-tRNA synthetase beta chain